MPDLTRPSSTPAQIHRAHKVRRADRRHKGLALFAVVCATLVVGGAPARGAPVTPGTPTPDGGLAQTIDPDQPVVSGPVTLRQGHADIGPLLRNGRWTIGVHDDTAVPSVWRSPADVVLDVRDTARLTAPRDKAYGFLGAAAGRPVYVIPQTQNRDVVWTGWNTQDPAVLSQLSLGSTFTFHGVRGPGQLFVFLQSGALGAPDLLWSSTKTGPQKLFVERNTHTHANWVFTAPGVYLVDFEITGKLVSGRTVTDRQALRFAVGDKTDPTLARTAELTTPTDTPATTAGDSPSATSSSAAAADPNADSAAGSGGTGMTWLIALGIVLVLAAAVIVTTLRSRRLAARVHGSPSDETGPL